MNKLLLLCASALLTGCATPLPVSPSFPSAPELLRKECEKLMILEQGAKLSDVAKSVTENYTRYHECARLVKGWNEWYDEQKKIYEQAGKK